MAVEPHLSLQVECLLQLSHVLVEIRAQRIASPLAPRNNSGPRTPHAVRDAMVTQLGRQRRKRHDASAHSIESAPPPPHHSLRLPRLLLHLVLTNPTRRTEPHIHTQHQPWLVADQPGQRKEPERSHRTRR